MMRLKILLRSDAGNFIHLGIALTFVLLSIESPIAMILFCAECVFLWKNHRRLFYLAVLTGIFIVGKSIVILSSSSTLPDEPVVATVIDSKDDRLTCRIDREKWYVYHDGSQMILPGDRIRLVGSVMESDEYRIPHGFDYERYLHGNDISGVYYAEEITLLASKFHLNRIKIAFKDYVIANFDLKTAPMVFILLFGDDSLLDPQMHSDIQNLGIMHLFAISGMHVGLVAAMLRWLLKRLYVKVSTEQIAIVVLLMIYTFLTGFSASMVRASLLVFMIFFGQTIKWPFSRLDAMTFILIGFYLVNPLCIHLVGFQLSFLVSFAIILGSEYLAAKVEVVTLLKLSFFATLISLPILLEMNGGVSIWAVPMSVFFTLLVAKILLPGLFLTLMIPLLEPVYRYFVVLFYQGVGFFAPLNLMLEFNFTDPIAKTLYWGIVLWILVRGPALRRTLLAMMMVALLVLATLTKNHVPGLVSVTVLDVGQAEAIHLHDDSCDLLIDTGNPDAQDHVINYFKKSNIHQLDMIFITHSHSDHDGELDDIIEALQVDVLIGAGDHEVPGTVEQIIPVAGQKLVCGSFRIDILHYSELETNANNNSLVMTVEVGSDLWLFTGDMETRIEMTLDPDILRNIDVVKVPHHGSSTSSSEYFSKQMTPRFAIISVGALNNYGLPSQPVIDRWGRQGAEILRTDVDGTIRFLYFQPFTEPIISTHIGEKNTFSYLKRIFRFDGSGFQ